LCLDGRVVECKSDAVGNDAFARQAVFPNRGGVTRQRPVAFAKRLRWDMIKEAEFDARRVDLRGWGTGTVAIVAIAHGGGSRGEGAHYCVRSKKSLIK
jgi:hypothetical protein